MFHLTHSSDDANIHQLLIFVLKRYWFSCFPLLALIDKTDTWTYRVYHRVVYFDDLSDVQVIKLFNQKLYFKIPRQC